MIRKRRLAASVMAGIMAGMLVAGNIPAQNVKADVQQRPYESIMTRSSSVDGYVPLDSEHPVTFGGTWIEYDGQRITLGENAIYLDGSLSDEVAGKYEYVYNDIKDALSAAALKDGTEESPMTVYVAPYVYWIDDPEATDTVQPSEGYGVPYGMIVECENLTIQGLTDDPYNVVFAGNRGQSHGSNGNYTMFRFNGSGLTVKNITIGNYCSVDLEYPLKPELNHAKRTTTITQAQLADMSGDKMYADNCNFISRLNLDPINGADRSLYNNCHFESTDDAINGNAVFVGCDFDFYGNRPLYSSYNTGSTFLGCTFNSLIMNIETEPTQYFTKEGGTIIAVDCVFKSNFSVPLGIAWTKYPSSSLKCYQFNILHNGEAITIGGEDAAETVDMTGKDVLSAYRIVTDEGEVVYNTYNLLKGSDGWDPLNVKDDVIAAGADNTATLLTLNSDISTIESGTDTAAITNTVKYFHGETAENVDVTYSVADEYKPYVKITPNADGSCTVEGTNDEDEAKTVIVNASTASGLEAAAEFTVKPSVLSAPEFTKMPEITNDGNGSLKVDYSLDLGDRADQSLISWYRCEDAQGSNPVLVAVTRNDEPEYTYQLSASDIGYYIKAVVEPKNIRSNPGEPVETIYSEAVTVKDVKTKNFTTDFSNFPVENQTEIKPGFWTSDYYRPLDTMTWEEGKWQGNPDATAWVYGETGNGSVGQGIYQGTQGARLMYTPVEGEYGDMSLKLVVDPAKTEGQGFGSANQYMDVCLKFDTTTLTGYGLRIIRTAAASDAVTFVLVKYENGQTSYISDEIIASCYMTGCEITLNITGNKLTAHVETSTGQLASQAEKGWVHEVNLSADIDTNAFGGVAIQHTGTTGSGGWQNTTMLHSLDIEWTGENNQNPEYVEPEEPDTEQPDTGSDGQTGEGDGSSVNTGDTADFRVWMVMAVVSAAGLSAAGVYASKRSKRSLAEGRFDDK